MTLHHHPNHGLGSGGPQHDASASVEAAFHFGFPLDAGAVLIMEVDGLAAGLDAEAASIEEIARKNRARDVRRAGDGVVAPRRL